MKKFFIPFFLSCCLFCAMGCGSKNAQIQTSDTSMEKHIVNITNDNYKEFITIEINYVVGSSVAYSYHYFRGALSYAFYDNVIITYNFSSNDNVAERTLLLNVGGCGTIQTHNSRAGSTSYEITNVSGTIIYWI